MADGTADEVPDKGSSNDNQHGDEDAAGIFSGHDQLGDCVDDETDNGRPKQTPHSCSSVLIFRGCRIHLEFDGKRILLALVDAINRSGGIGEFSVDPTVRDGRLTDMNDTPIDADVRMGHVHLKVADLERALGFYCGVLGFELMQRFGDSAAFLSAGGYHHHIGLNTWESKGGAAPAAGTTGLYHLAILYPTRAELGDALYRVIEAGIELDGASDHGVSEALYLRDPDQNGVELYRDRPQEEWPRAPDGSLAMFTKRLDLEDLLRHREA